MMKGNDLLHNGKSYAAAAVPPAVGTVSLEEPLEHARLVFLGNPDACVGGPDCHMPVGFLDADGYSAAVRGKFNAVANDIRPYLT
jgi:hypothetical protein